MVYRWGMVLLFLMGLMNLGANGVSADLTVVEIREKAEVSGSEIEIGELIEVEGLNEDLIGQIQSIKLGAVPWPGSFRTISRANIQTRLRQHKVDLSQIEFRGAMEVVVTTKSIKVNGSDIVKAARDYILENMPWDKEEVIIETSRIPKERVIPEGVREKLNFKVTYLSRNNFLGVTQLSVGLYVDRQLYVAVPLSLTIRVFKEVVVAKRVISRYETLTERDLSLRRSDITYLPRDILTDIFAVAGKRAERLIPANAVLTKNMVGVPLAVKRGEVVTLLLVNERIEIVAKGKAVENGRVGETIRVKNIDSRKDIYGRVMDSQTVKVPF